MATNDSKSGIKLSSRTDCVVSFSDPVRDASEATSANRYHETQNPQGIVDLCMSQNTLISDLILDKLQQPELLKWDETMLTYTERKGTKRLRVAIATYLEDQTGSPQKIDPDMMCCMNGVTGVMNLLTYVLFDEGDTVLCPAPFYYSIPRDIMYISKVKTYPVPLSSKPGANGLKAFELTVDHLEKGLQKAREEGHRVRGVFLVNPSNPLGLVYTKEQVQAYLAFCKKYSLHVIMDEIYQCSNHDESTANSSVLGLPLVAVPDPQRTHMLYGFSKDFGIPGSPLGVLHTWNQDVLERCVSLNDYQQASSFIQSAAAKMLEDKDWLRRTYFPTNLSRIRDACRITMETLDEIGASYFRPQAGLFIWANLGKFLSQDTEEGEKRLTFHLLKGGVGLSPSAGYCGGEYGWYRIMFAVPRHRLTEGLRRLKESCLSFSTAP
ncbi:1-aminocyclopropane-1-carboxylate synthase-like protein 1 [Strongylocentrotus purpuratus]|uniref:Aminotransferase class I/classII large domain-containing protein n=1 Tax=Strongylocentrotus purpuratus TaxID=7668 RepID=A0A7M7P2A0_STRPU|nr:1-aminocyclopropane-1-carboxylate synthase-like protein 1 [Strongylocentrotus purpuratus]